MIDIFPKMEMRPGDIAEVEALGNGEFIVRTSHRSAAGALDDWTAPRRVTVEHAGLSAGRPA